MPKIFRSCSDSNATWCSYIAMKSWLAAHNAGFEHLGFLSSDLQQNQNLLAAVENFDWAHSGLKFTVEVDSMTSVANHDSLSDVFNAITGIDLITGTGLTDGETWGTLLHTLQQSGLGDIDVQKNAGNTVHISDDLSAALYESGMLHALPDAAIAIDAGANKVLNTSLKAMADLGVDSVNADHKVYVELGIQVADIHTLADLGDLFSAFGLDSSVPDTQLFGTQGAGLVVNQAAFDHFSAMSPADVQTLLGELSKLGFTEVDVMGTSQVSAVYNINVTAQTPVLSQVAIIGADTTNDLTHVFDPDILTRTVK